MSSRNQKHLRNPELFGPDEEIGAGADKSLMQKDFNVGLLIQWTVVLSGELQYETFSAVGAEMSFKGRKCVPRYQAELKWSMPSS